MRETPTTILAVIHSPFYGGLHNIFVKIVPRLAARGYALAVALPESGPGIDRLRVENVKTFGLPLRRLRRTLNPVTHLKTAVGIPLDILAMRRLIKRERVEIVLICGLVNPQGAVAAKLAGAKVVWQLHSDFAPMWLRRVTMPLVRLLADVLMVNGDRIADLHPGSRGFGDRMIKFAAPVDTDAFHPPADAERQHARRELDVADDELCVGTVGVRSFQKAHEHLVEAAALVVREVPNAKFRILGTPIATSAGYYERDVIARAKELGLLDGPRPALQFVDPGRRVAGLMPAFDVFTLSSRSEGVPTVMLEAMACAIPCAVTAVGSVPEALADAGVTVPPGDPKQLAAALIELLRDRQRRAASGQQGRRRAVDLFSTDRSVDSHVAAFDLALGNADAQCNVSDLSFKAV